MFHAQIKMFCIDNHHKKAFTKRVTCYSTRSFIYHGICATFTVSRSNLHTVCCTTFYVIFRLNPNHSICFCNASDSISISFCFFSFFVRVRCREKKPHAKCCDGNYLSFNVASNLKTARKTTKQNEIILVKNGGKNSNQTAIYCKKIWITRDLPAFYNVVSSLLLCFASLFYSQKIIIIVKIIVWE